MKYVIANWKAHFTLTQADQWIDSFLQNDFSSFQDVEIIICAPYHLLSWIGLKTKNINNLRLGTQNISQYEDGAFTGEITASMIADLASYSIIGHSERRKYFEENNSILEIKANHAMQHNIQPIFCVRDQNDPIPTGIQYLAYEPIESIGTGSIQPIEEILEMKKKLPISSSMKFIYGGSVDENNSHQYIQNSEIDGFLVGSASLDPEKFYRIITSIK